MKLKSKRFLFKLSISKLIELRFACVWCLLPLFNNNILDKSCRSVLFVEETEVPGENHRPAASH
jgi:hypothetical protein